MSSSFLLVYFHGEGLAGADAMWFLPSAMNEWCIMYASENNWFEPPEHIPVADHVNHFLTDVGFEWLKEHFFIEHIWKNMQLLSPDIMMLVNYYLNDAGFLFYFSVLSVCVSIFSFLIL
jgi:hypothetical protein